MAGGGTQSDMLNGIHRVHNGTVNDKECASFVLGALMGCHTYKTEKKKRKEKEIIKNRAKFLKTVKGSKAKKHVTKFLK